MVVFWVRGFWVYQRSGRWSDFWNIQLFLCLEPDTIWVVVQLSFRWVNCWVWHTEFRVPVNDLYI